MTIRRIRGKGDTSRARPAHPAALMRIDDYLAGAGHGEELDGALLRPVRAPRAGTHALAQGADITEVQHWPGHADISTTRRHYDKRRQQYERSPTLRMRV